MSDSTGGSLNAAYEAIKAKDLAKARDVLSAYLVEQPNDVDAWWLYSYAVTDVEQGRKALETVLRLDPAYPGARDLLNELDSASPSPAIPEPVAPAAIRAVSRPSEYVPLTTTVEPEDSDAEFGFADEEPESGGSNRTLLVALAALLILAVVAAILVLPNLNQPATEGTTVASTSVSATDPASGLATDEPTLDSSLLTGEAPTEEATLADLPTDTAPTSEFATLEAPTGEAPLPTSDAGTGTGSGDEALYDALSTFNVLPDSAVVEPTQLGQTQAVSICAVSSELRALIPSALTAVAGISTQLPAETQAVGAKFVNCTDNTVLRYVALNIADAQAYANGTLTDADLRSRFVPLP